MHYSACTPSQIVRCLHALPELLPQWGGCGGLRIEDERDSLTMCLYTPDPHIGVLQSACFTVQASFNFWCHSLNVESHNNSQRLSPLLASWCFHGYSWQDERERPCEEEVDSRRSRSKTCELRDWEESIPSHPFSSSLWIYSVVHHLLSLRVAHSTSGQLQLRENTEQC